MEGFFQAVGCVLITVVLCLTVGSQNKSFSTLLGMIVCTMVLLLGLHYMEPVAVFVRELESVGDLSGDMVRILLKTGLICMLTEISALICSDSGSSSLAQALKITGSVVILWMSLPVLRGLLDLVQKILEGI